MFKVLFSFVCVCSLGSECLEIYLPTRTNVKLIYISRINTDPVESDWRYFDELRNILVFDLHVGGYAESMPIRQDLEESLDWNSLCSNFKIDAWKKASCSQVLAMEVQQRRLMVTLIDIEREVFKRYSEIPLSGCIEEDRGAMHRLSDMLHWDIFQVKGIASQRILYVQRVKNSETGALGFLSEIWSCDADGANVRQLTFRKGYCLSPGFFLNYGEDAEFFYVFNDEGQSKIYAASFSHPEGRLLVSLRGNQILPAISATGRQLAFVADAAGRPDLFLQVLDSKKRMLGRARQIYSSPRATQASPTFSPDEKQIAFVSDKDGPPRIYLLDLPSVKDMQRPRPRLLTTKNRENTSPAWSPDGKKLAYSAKVDGIRQIWVYDFEMKEERQLTFGPEVKENPAWAPDSFHLIYNTESEESCELFLINLAKTNPVQISKGFGQKRFACWEQQKK